MPTLVRFREPFREIAALQHEMGRLMGSVLDGGGGSTTNEAWTPAVDVWETEKEVVYAFDLPGVSQDKISLELHENTLTVRAERERTQEVSQERLYRFERRFGTFSRTIALPQGVAEDAVTADYRDGVLEVHVPKPEQQQPRRIQVGSASQSTTINGTASPSE